MDFVGAILLILSAFFVYMSSHIISEEKAGKSIPLPWERMFKKERKVFDKSDIEYRDGDNT